MYNHSIPIDSLDYRKEYSPKVREWAVLHIRAFNPYSMTQPDLPASRLVFESGDIACIRFCLMLLYSFFKRLPWLELHQMHQLDFDFLSSLWIPPFACLPFDYLESTKT